MYLAVSPDPGLGWWRPDASAEAGAASSTSRTTRTDLAERCTGRTPLSSERDPCRAAGGTLSHRRPGVPQLAREASLWVPHLGPEAALSSRRRAAVAQLARASACHAEGRGFESHQPLVRKPAYSLGCSSPGARAELVFMTRRP